MPRARQSAASGIRSAIPAATQLCLNSSLSALGNPVARTDRRAPTLRREPAALDVEKLVTEWRGQQRSRVTLPGRRWNRHAAQVHRQSAHLKGVRFGGVFAIRASAKSVQHQGQRGQATTPAGLKVRGGGDEGGDIHNQALGKGLLKLGCFLVCGGLRPSEGGPAQLKKLKMAISLLTQARAMMFFPGRRRQAKARSASIKGRRIGNSGAAAGAPQEPFGSTRCCSR